MPVTCASTVLRLPPKAREVVSNRADRIIKMTAKYVPRLAIFRIETQPFLRNCFASTNREGRMDNAFRPSHAPKNGGHSMKENINYLGMVNLLRSLNAAGLVNRKEARKIAARLKSETGADIIVSL